MALGAIFLITAGSAGLASGFSAAFMFLKRGTLSKNPDGEYSLKVLLFGAVASYSKPQYGGIFVDDVDDTRNRLGILGRYLDNETMLAGYRPSGGSRGGYDIFLNPDFDLEEVSSRLSQELETAIAPADVYAFLFLHEIGHTERAGNKNFHAAMVNLALSGRMRSLKNRLELKAAPSYPSSP